MERGRKRHRERVTVTQYFVTQFLRGQDIGQERNEEMEGEKVREKNQKERKREKNQKDRKRRKEENEVMRVRG